MESAKQCFIMKMFGKPKNKTETHFCSMTSFPVVLLFMPLYNGVSFVFWVKSTIAVYYWHMINVSICLCNVPVFFLDALNRVLRHHTVFRTESPSINAVVTSCNKYITHYKTERSQNKDYLVGNLWMIMYSLLELISWKYMYLHRSIILKSVCPVCNNSMNILP